MARLMTFDERLHFWGGFWMGLRASWKPLAKRQARLLRIYLYGWNREVEQHGPDLSPHQVAEARAWGLGAAKALRLKGSPAPSPPYPSEGVGARSSR